MNNNFYTLSASKPNDEVDIVVAWDNSTPPQLIWVKDNVNLRPANLSAEEVIYMISSEMMEEGYNFYPHKVN